MLPFSYSILLRCEHVIYCSYFSLSSLSFHLLSSLLPILFFSPTLYFRMFILSSSLFYPHLLLYLAPSIPQLIFFCTFSSFGFFVFFFGFLWGGGVLFSFFFLSFFLFILLVFFLFLSFSLLSLSFFLSF